MPPSSDETAALQARIAELEAEAAATDKLISRFWECNVALNVLWRAEDPAARGMTLNDMTKLSEWAAAKITRLEALINTPVIDDFIEGVQIEMPHQVARWGESHDADKTASDWIRLGVHLLGKASMADWQNDPEKLKHHVITVAAAMGNFHALIKQTEADDD